MPAPPEGTTFQIQESPDHLHWYPMQPHPDGGLIHGGDHWFSDHHRAWVAANRLRSNTMWIDVRIVHRAPDGSITREQDVL